jgi:hypothetical protein
MNQTPNKDAKNSAAVDDFTAGEMNELLVEGEQSIQREGTLDADEALAARRAHRLTSARK